jgi:allantoinase
MAREYKWPDGKRIAVAVTAMLETWSDGKGPAYGVQASQLKPGTPDYAGIAWGSYGGKVGVYRLISLFKDNGIVATFAVNGRCAEIYPDAVKTIVASGHDVAGHGWFQDQLLSYLAPEEERAVIARSLDVLERTTGIRPAGWISPSMAFTLIPGLFSPSRSSCGTAMPATATRRALLTVGARGVRSCTFRAAISPTTGCCD